MCSGGVAQLGERMLRMYEVAGSNPVISTNDFRRFEIFFQIFFVSFRFINRVLQSIVYINYSWHDVIRGDNDDYIYSN